MSRPPFPPGERRDVRVAVPVRPATKAAWDAAAAERGVSTAAMIRDAVEAYISAASAPAGDPPHVIAAIAEVLQATVESASLRPDDGISLEPVWDVVLSRSDPRRGRNAIAAVFTSTRMRSWRAHPCQPYPPPEHSPASAAAYLQGDNEDY